jgi:hypothetical protein
MTMLSKFFSKKPKVQCVAAHLYNDKIILVAQNEVKSGFWIYTDFHEVLPTTISNDSLGERIRILSTYSMQGVRDPKSKEDFKEIENKLLIAGGFKTQKDSRQGKYCNIMFEDDEIEISPTINEGSKGFNYFKAEFLIENNSSNNELGQALRSGWEICK